MLVMVGCAPIPKAILNSPLNDNNNNKFNPPGIRKKGIKHCEITPFDVKNGIITKKKDTYIIYFDKMGRYFKEEKYHIGHLVEYSTYYFDNSGNLQQATKYLLFPERSVSANAEFDYNRDDNVTKMIVQQGESKNTRLKEYDEHGNMILQTYIREREKKGKIKIDTSIKRYEYVLDDKNRVLEKLVFDHKRNRYKGKYVNVWKGKNLYSEAVYNSKDKLRRMKQFRYNEEGKVIKETLLNSQMEKDEQFELLYDKWGNFTQKNGVIPGFENFGTKSKYNKLGNIVREEMYDIKTDKLKMIWKYDYYKE